jgi:hypothetical protein
VIGKRNAYCVTALLVAGCGGPASTDDPTDPGAANGVDVGDVGASATEADSSDLTGGTEALPPAAATSGNEEGVPSGTLSPPSMGTAAGAVVPPDTTTPATGPCCAEGVDDCICRDLVPSAPTSSEGPFATDSFSHSSGCIYYPTDAEPPFSFVTVSDGFLGTGGCGAAQTSGWGPLYASWGIVTNIISTGGGDQPRTRGEKLSAAIEAMKALNADEGSPIGGMLHPTRYGTSGFSMGGGGTSFSAQADPTLRTSIQLMPWTPVSSGIEVPTLIVMGTSDGLAGDQGAASYQGIDDSIPKMQVFVNSGHVGQPSAGGGDSGAAGLAFQKVFLDGDERWRSILLMVDFDETNIQ